MEAATSANDPYDEPFNWPTSLEAECPELRLFGLLPCAQQCEQGWLPLIDGTMIACPECNGGDDDGRES